jgi:hypothetical protein
MIGKILTLRGVSQKGKNRVNENGKRWMILQVEESIIVSKRSGPWFLVGSCSSNDFRWIQQNDDLNFVIEEVE